MFHLPPDANGLVGDPLAGNPTNAQFTPNIFNFFGLDQPFWNGWRQSKSLGGRSGETIFNSAQINISGAPLPTDRGHLLLANTANLLAKPQGQNC